VSPTQTAFMRGRNILDGVVVIHENCSWVASQEIEWGHP
jgi:phosphate starvation-inducible protein PhoH